MTDDRRKILCVEDDREVAALIAEELSDRGFEVSVAYDGRDGFQAILKDMPDLVLCDINMPIMSGFEVLERLTAIAPRFGLPTARPTRSYAVWRRGRALPSPAARTRRLWLDTSRLDGWAMTHPFSVQPTQWRSLNKPLTGGCVCPAADNETWENYRGARAACRNHHLRGLTYDEIGSGRLGL